MTQDHKKLNIWRKSHNLTLELYKLTADCMFPKSERFGLVDQIRRSASSIGSNIAEGCGQATNKNFKRYLYMAFGSMKELENHLELAKDLGYLSADLQESVISKLVRLEQMTQSFIKKL